MVPSIRSRRAVSNDGPHLSVAYDLTSSIKVFDGKDNGNTAEDGKTSRAKLWNAEGPSLIWGERLGESLECRRPVYPYWGQRPCGPVRGPGT